MWWVMPKACLSPMRTCHKGSWMCYLLWGWSFVLSSSSPWWSPFSATGTLCMLYSPGPSWGPGSAGELWGWSLWPSSSSWSVWHPTMCHMWQDSSIGKAKAGSVLSAAQCSRCLHWPLHFLFFLLSCPQSLWWKAIEATELGWIRVGGPAAERGNGSLSMANVSFTGD